jgi:hypothetical protein
MPLEQSPEQAIRQVGDELRARARLSGSFLKPVELAFGAWGVMLSFGTAAEMSRLRHMENERRAQMKLPPMDPNARSADTWHFSARLLMNLQELQKIDAGVTKSAYDQLGMLASAVGIPQSQLIRTPVETIGKGENIVHWEWRDD